MFTPKAPGIEDAMESLAGKRRTAGECVFCPAEVTPDSFKDELSKKEYAISGMCQECQDKTFGG